MSSFPDSQAAKNKVKVPAILLIVTGVLSVLISLYLIGAGAVTVLAPGTMAGMQTPEQKAQMEKAKQQGVNPDSIFAGVGIGYIAWGLLGVVGSALIIFSGVKMMGLSSYGLAMTGSILAMIPCTSPCCIIGLIAGIWSLVVLMNADVKASFR